MGGWPTFALLFLQRWGAEDSCSAGLPSHLRRFPLKYRTWLASAESINPRRDRLVEANLSKNERWATRQNLRASTQNSLAREVSLGLGGLRFRTLSCWRSARLSRSRLWREQKKRAG